MNFRDAENYLFSLGNEVETMKLGLENITRLLDALGRPQENYLKVQVAGTNGKGSVCAFLDSICGRANIRTGRFTSPHLISITERIKIDGVDIAEEEFGKLATRVREVGASLVASGVLEKVPTFFEQVTAIALLAFAEAGVEIAILETGLGGRYDATTAANAEIAAITRIDLDHQQYLGDTIKKIAAEKAAIIRPDSRVVIGWQTAEAEDVILERCREVGVEPVRADEVTEIAGGHGNDGPFHRFDLITARRSYNDVELSIRGAHQGENAAVAVAVAEMLHDEGWRISEAEILSGLKTAKNPGRLERIGKFVLDGAHNPAAARALAAFLKDFVPRPVTMVFGAMKDKSVAEMLDTLVPRVNRIVLTKSENTRAMEPAEIENLLHGRFPAAKISTGDSVKEALRIAAEMSDDGAIVVTGSLYLVGEAKKILADNPEIGFEISDFKSKI